MPGRSSRSTEETVRSPGRLPVFVMVTAPTSVSPGAMPPTVSSEPSSELSMDSGPPWPAVSETSGPLGPVVAAKATTASAATNAASARSVRDRPGRSPSGERSHRSPSKNPLVRIRNLGPSRPARWPHPGSAAGVDTAWLEVDLPAGGRPRGCGHPAGDRHPASRSLAAGRGRAGLPGVSGGVRAPIRCPPGSAGGPSRYSPPGARRRLR